MFDIDRFFPSAERRSPSKTYSATKTSSAS
jgi:hypothetical protein